MARPQMDSRVDAQSPTAPQSCRMEMLRRDAWPSGNSVPQPRHRHRPTATQTSPVLPRAVSTQDTLRLPNAPHHESSLGDNTGMGPELPSTGMQQPLPDILPESQSSSQQDLPAEEEPTLEEQAIQRVAIHLRTIGDEMNAVYLQRRNEAPQWQNWRGLYRGLVAFLADTISTLYQHGLR